MSTVTWTLELEGDYASSISPARIEELLFAALAGEVKRVEVSE